MRGSPGAWKDGSVGWTFGTLGYWLCVAASTRRAAFAPPSCGVAVVLRHAPMRKWQWGVRKEVTAEVESLTSVTADAHGGGGGRVHGRVNGVTWGWGELGPKS